MVQPEARLPSLQPSVLITLFDDIKRWCSIIARLPLPLQVVPQLTIFQPNGLPPTNPKQVSDDGAYLIWDY